MRVNENELFLPHSDARDVDVLHAIDAIRCLPGCVAVAFDEKRTKYGELYVPEGGEQAGVDDEDLERYLDAWCEEFTRLNLIGVDPSERKEVLAVWREREKEQVQHLRKGSNADGVGAAGKLRPDSGTVLSSDAFPVIAGCRVLIRPYHGLWLDKITTPSGYSCDDVRFYGVTRPIDQSIIAYWAASEWVPLFDWIEIKRDAKPTELYIAKEGSKPKASTAVVTKAGSDATVKPGQRIVLDSHPNNSLMYRFGNDGLELIKQVDDDGIPQVWAVIEDE